MLEEGGFYIESCRPNLVLVRICPA